MENPSERIKSKGLKLKNQFIYGALNGIELQLNGAKTQMKRQKSSEEEALVLIYEQKLSDYTSYKYPKVYSTHQSKHIQLSGAYYEGYAQGKKIKIKKILFQEINKSSFHKLFCDLSKVFFVIDNFSHVSLCF